MTTTAKSSVSENVNEPVQFKAKVRRKNGDGFERIYLTEKVSGNQIEIVVHQSGSFHIYFEPKDQTVDMGDFWLNGRSSMVISKRIGDWEPYIRVNRKPVKISKATVHRLNDKPLELTKSVGTPDEMTAMIREGNAKVPVWAL